MDCTRQYTLNALEVPRAIGHGAPLGYMEHLVLLREADLYLSYSSPYSKKKNYFIPFKQTY